MPTTIDLFSLATVPVEQFFNEQHLGTATAFLWQERGAFYLITNWHVVTCVNPITGEPLSEHAGRPNMLRMWLNPRVRDFGKVQNDLPIRDAEDRPLWFVHPSYRKKVDVVAIPLRFRGDEPGFELHPINVLASSPLSIQIGMDVFVLGYPFGAEPPGFPVWKRGSIASEPQLAPLGYGYMLVDTASRPGMSGAPVIRRSWSNHVLESGETLPLSNRFETRLIGIYSGRRWTKQENDAQLGMVWPESYIPEIIALGRRDEWS